MGLPISLESYTVENQDGPGPYGLKGMSEGGLLAVPPVRLRSSSLRVGPIWRTLRAFAW